MSNNRMTVRVSDNINEMVLKVEDILLSAPDIELYQRAGELIEVIARDGSPMLSAIHNSRLVSLVSKCVRFVSVRLDKEGNEKEATAAIPKPVIDALYWQRQWRLAYLDGIIHTPTFRPDGSLLHRPGYDLASRLIYHPPPHAAFKVPDKPSREQALDALELLRDLFADFLFETPIFESANLAALLTVLVRPAIDGHVPVFSFEATTQATGKTLLAQLHGIIATGADVTCIPESRNEEEDCKRLTPLISRGTPIILIDNITRRFGHGAIASSITSGTWGDRQIGSADVGPWKNRAVWFLTGNNLAYQDDFLRRVIPVYLDAGVERPEERAGFRHPNIHAFGRKHRAILVSAALTLIAAYRAAKEPVSLTPYGSFEEWSEWIRAPLVWLGLPDPCLARARADQHGDSGTASFSCVLSLWRQQFGGDVIRVRDLVEKAEEDLIDAIASIAPSKGRESFNVQTFAFLLRKYRDRPIRGLKLCAEQKNDGRGVRWKVAQVEPKQAVLSSLRF